MHEIVENIMCGLLCEKCYGLIDGKETGNARLCKECEESETDE